MRPASRFFAALLLSLSPAIRGGAHAHASDFPTPVVVPATDARLVLSHGALRRELSAAELAALPAIEFDDTKDGVAQRYRGVPVRELLALVEAPLGPALHGPHTALAVRATAADGYVVAFALAEFDPAYRPVDKTIFLALTLNGAPLPAKAAPWRLVCPGDQRHSRWIRQLVSLEVVSLRPLPTP